MMPLIVTKANVKIKKMPMFAKNRKKKYRMQQRMSKTKKLIRIKKMIIPSKLMANKHPMQNTLN